MRIFVADHSCDSALRELMRKVPVPGRMTITYMREPDFFYGLTVQGVYNETLIALQNDSAVWMGCRSVKPMYINGSVKDFGYLSGLRGLPHVRNNIGLARGYKKLRELHNDNRVPAYITTIIDDNNHAKSVLTSRKGALPYYIDWGAYITHAISLKRVVKIKDCIEHIAIQRVASDELDDILRFINEQNTKYQFAPFYKRDFFESEFLRGMKIEDLYVARVQGKIVGVLGSWDQSAYKQTVVSAYDRITSLLRPLYNCWAAINDGIKLPPSGTQFSYFTFGFCSILDNDYLVYRALMKQICIDRMKDGYDYCLAGFHERDTLLKSMNGLLAIKYISRIYVVCWEEGREFVENLDRNLVPYLELGSL